MDSTFIKLRAGLQEHMELGRLSLFDVGVYVSIHFQADYERGTWIGCAGKVLAKCPRKGNLRQIRHSISRLEAIGFIKCFRKPHGARGNYTAVINKYEVPFGALKGMRVNAEKSKSYDNIHYEACPHTAVTPPSHRRDTAPIQDLDLDLRTINTKSKTVTSTAKDFKTFETLPSADSFRGTGVTPTRHKGIRWLEPNKE